MRVIFHRGVHILYHRLRNYGPLSWNVLGSACHTPRQPLQNYPSGHFGGWPTLWSAEEMLDGQIQVLTSLLMPELLTMASCRNDWKRISAESPTCSSDDPMGQETELDWTESNHWEPRTIKGSFFLSLEEIRTEDRRQLHGMDRPGVRQVLENS